MAFAVGLAILGGRTPGPGDLILPPAQDQGNAPGRTSPFPAGWSLERAGVSVQAGQWREAPAYRDLFAPRAHREFYRAFVSPLPHDAALRTLGAFRGDVVQQSPLDAFGQSGGYDRSRLVRLYGARRVTVARGPRLENGRVIESWTVASPYPDAALGQLENGTLLIVLRVPPV